MNLQGTSDRSALARIEPGRLDRFCLAQYEKTCVTAALMR